MFLVFMISGGVTIQAILYPNYPLGIDLVKRVLTRPLFAMFLTQIADLDGKSRFPLLSFIHIQFDFFLMNILLNSICMFELYFFLQETRAVQVTTIMCR